MDMLLESAVEEVNPNRLTSRDQQIVFKELESNIVHSVESP